MAAFVVCLSMVVFFVAVYRFRIVDGVSKSVRYRSGHVQIHGRGYDEIARKFPLSITVPHTEQALAWLRANPKVRMASPRIRFFCNLSRGEEMLQAVGIAIVPEQEEIASLLPETIRLGRYLRSGDAGILVPERVAKLLRVKTGDTVRLKARNRFDVSNIVDAQVTGIIRPPFNSLDQTVFFLPLALAQELLAMDGLATEVAVIARNGNDADAILAEIRAQFAAMPVEVFDWRHYEPALVADIFIDTRFLAFFFGILLLISIFIMNNSMSMTVFERMREFGTMRALGMSKDTLLSLVSAESVLIGAAGSVAGCFIGALLCWYFGAYGIPTDVGELSSIPVSPRFYPISRPVEYVGCLALGALCGWLGGLWAALRARRLAVVDVLRPE
jgi:putative ABC transport system permease protein